MLNNIKEKVHNNDRITFDEGIYLLEKVSIYDLGQLANNIRRKITLT